MLHFPRRMAGSHRTVTADRSRSFNRLTRVLGFEPLETRQLLAATPVEIFAAGETGEETLELQIDGATVATFNNVGGDAVNGVFQSFNYTHPTAVSANQIRVAFTNNGIAAGGGDRNLRVDRITVGGVNYESEATTTFSVGSFVPGVGCTSGNNETETLYCDGYFEYASGGSTIEIFAAGETNEETMELQVDGTTVATFTNVGGDALTRTFDSYRYTHPTPLSLSQVRVAFTNNGVAAGGGDRNLSVDRISLDGQDFETEAPTTFSVGSFVSGIGCTSGNNETETLYCDGYFEYSQPAGSTFEIFAAGETNEETLELQIDGSTVATFENVGGDALAGTFETLRYTHTSAVTIDQIRVAFTNNGNAANGNDRNLRVDKIVVDGTTYETEADDTYSVGSFLPGLGCTEGTLQTETLYCDGYFEYQTSSNPGTLALGTTAVSVNEQDGTVSIPVVRTGGSDGAVSLNYTTVDASAVAGQDYTLTAGQVVFEPGQTTAFIVVPILDDGSDEGNETFNVATDQTQGGAVVGQPRTATITILDDDGGPTIGTGNGLLGAYYNDDSFLDFEFERTDQTLNYDWGSGSPDPRIGSDTFSIVWTGQIEALYSETYTFEVGIDDGIRLWINDTLVIDEFQDQNTTHTGQISLQGGIRNDIRIEYYENGGGARMQLRWSSPSQSFEVVPQTQLYSDPPSNIDGTFTGETVISGLTQPTALEFTAGDRMFIAQKDGVVRVAQNGNLLSQPFVDISSRVNNVQDRGLIGMTVHPNFPATPYVYLLYTYEDPTELANSGNAGPDGRGNRVARLERFTADASDNFNQATANTGTVILGTNSTWDNISFPDQDGTNNVNLPDSCGPGGTLEDCLPVDSRSHSIGTVLFGTDGALYVSNGDGTSFGQVDPRTTRVQDLDSLAGKILRIDPITGDGLSDNPFYNGDPDANRSKVYSYGLRNPFRFAINPTNGEPYIGDVGWNSWEEINTGEASNFGWPFYEGGNGQNLQTGGYNNLSEATAFYANNNAEAPFWSRSHPDGGTAVIAGDFYTGAIYPDVLDGALFFTDFGDKIIRALVLNADGSLNRQLVLADPVGSVVEMTMGPDDFMYYVDLAGGSIGRFEFTTNNVNGGSEGSETGNSGSGAAAVGDFDSDGDTDGSDFLAWQRGFGMTGAATLSDGDADGSETVDDTDLAVWLTNYPAPSTPAAPVAAAAYWQSLNSSAKVPQTVGSDITPAVSDAQPIDYDAALLSLSTLETDDLFSSDRQNADAERDDVIVELEEEDFLAQLI
ncbi:MAG: carbohydrate-binding domain-containing protein [Planctomycetota bacterium]